MTMFLGIFIVRLFVKITYFFAIRGHLQPLDVNSRTFDDILSRKRTFFADILHLSSITRNKCMTHTGYNILPGLLCTKLISKQGYICIELLSIHISTSRPTLKRFDFIAFAAVTFCFCCLLRVRDVASVIL